MLRISVLRRVPEGQQEGSRGCSEAEPPEHGSNTNGALEGAPEVCTWVSAAPPGRQAF